MERKKLELADDSLFIEKIKSTLTTEDANLLTRVYAFLKKKVCALEAVSFRAVDLLLNQNADAVTIAGALIVPLIWQGLIGSNEIQKHFGPNLATLLKDLDSPLVLQRNSRTYQRPDMHALLTSIGSSPIKALLFITFRLLALENPSDHKSNLQLMAQETLDLYVPIANRLSLGEVRRRLEDACFRILDPSGYEYLRHKITPIQTEDDKCLHMLLTGVQRLLSNNSIQGRIQGRTKSLHAIRRKMNRTGRNLENIMDRIGLRVIVTTVPECYTVLGLLHSHFKPIPGTFDDYIGLPKDNGYQSLHTCVYPVREISQKPIEFQVRTELMHMESEHGTAAHWRYKNETETDTQNDLKIKWMESLVHQHAKADSTESFIDLLHKQVFNGHLVVFGNGGRIVRLSENATVKDYLNISNLHSFEGMVFYVNGKVASIDQPLRDGDSIEISASCDLNRNQSTNDGKNARNQVLEERYSIDRHPDNTKQTANVNDHQDNKERQHASI